MTTASKGAEQAPCDPPSKPVESLSWRDVACPRCGALPGEPCKQKRNGRPSESVGAHKPRRVEAALGGRVSRGARARSARCANRSKRCTAKIRTNASRKAAEGRPFARASYGFKSEALLALLEEARSRHALVFGWLLDDGAEVLRVDQAVTIAELDGGLVKVTLDGAETPVSALVDAARKAVRGAQ